MAECTIQDCTKTINANGFCSAHYHRQQRYGDPLAGPRAPYFLSPEERFWHYVDKTSSSKGCWLWSSGGRTKDGYVLFEIKNKPGDRQSMLAHRYAWSLANGRDPEEELHHTCYVRHCVNPDHLIEATRQQNLSDGNERRQLERHAYEYLLNQYAGDEDRLEILLHQYANMNNGLG